MTANRNSKMSALRNALSSVHPFNGYEETITACYIVMLEGDGGLSLSKWEPYLKRFKSFDDLTVATDWGHASMSDDWTIGTVVDTQSGTVVASMGLPLPSGDEGARVTRLVRDWWVGAYKWPDFGIHINDNPE